MRFRDMFQRLFGRAADRSAFQRSNAEVPPSEMMEKLLTMLDRTQPTELSCDEVFAVLDQFAELAARGENVAQLMPLVKQHLEMCADCREEFEVLQSILESAA